MNPTTLNDLGLSEGGHFPSVKPSPSLRLDFNELGMSDGGQFLSVKPIPPLHSATQPCLADMAGALQLWYDCIPIDAARWQVLALFLVPLGNHRGTVSKYYIHMRAHHSQTAGQPIGQGSVCSVAGVSLDHSESAIFTVLR